MAPTPPVADSHQGVPQPLIWIVVPLLSVFGVGCFIFFMWRRHRRAHDPDNTDDRVIGPGGFLVTRSSRPWAAMGRDRSVEGLNELGEAPPPYEAKTPPPPPSPPPSPPAAYPGALLPQVQVQVQVPVEDAAGLPPRYCHEVSPSRDESHQEQEQEQQQEQEPRQEPHQEQEQQHEQELHQELHQEQEQAQEQEAQETQQQTPPAPQPLPVAHTTQQQTPPAPQPPPVAHTTQPPPSYIYA